MRFKRIGNREKFIVSRCVGRSVLHIGCTDSPFTEIRFKEGRLLHTKITAVSKTCLGVDLDFAAVAFLQSKGIANVAAASVEELSLHDQANFSRYDLVVAGEVLEHVDNLGLTLDQIKPLVGTEGRLLITVPNAFFYKGILRALMGREVVHPDHVAYYSSKTMSTMLSRYGFEVDSQGFSFQFSKSPLKAILKLPFYLAYLVNPMLGQSLILEAKVIAK